MATLPDRPLAGPWCAEPSAVDRAAVAPGPTIHVVYATPADAHDRFAERGRAIAADVEAIEAWWQREDPGRAPRFDRYAAPCGPQLDVTAARLSGDTRYFQRFVVDANLIETELADLGIGFDRRVMLVYWDGPAGDPEVCGEGGGDLGLTVGRSVVFMAACVDRDRARIVAHELLHTLGALAPGAPNACPNDDGHPCDSRDDLLWPTVDARPLEATRLDVGRDDYYGHDGAWVDTRDSPFLRRFDERPSRLVITIRGEGVVASPAFGLRCVRSCSTSWDTLVDVVLARRAGPGMRFVRFEGGCTGRWCRVSLGGGTTRVTAVFAPPTYDLVVEPSAGGRVIVAGRPCVTRCINAAPSYRALPLRAEAAAGWRFSHWRGACRGEASGCILPMERPASTRAVFVRDGD